MDRLAVRITGEYREMPGLALTLPQACRLWQLDARTCERLLDELVMDGTLARTPDGRFVALPTSRVVLKAALPPTANHRQAR